MILNIGIVLFVIGIAYWQGLQGFFSAFLHLMLVIVAGALAFAFWEPIAMGMLAGMMPRFAWSVGLVMPFFFFLLVLRIAMDKLVPANLDFSQVTNLALGGLCGAIAAVLSAGIFLIGVNYLPGAADNFGYRPYVINQANGSVVPNGEGGTLWISVDNIAEGVFSSLSSGTFAPANGKSLAHHQPQMVRRALLQRLRGDANSSVIATPGSVKVTAHFSHPTPAAGLPQLLIDSLKPWPELNVPELIKSDTHRLVAIETEWTIKDKNYDGDPRLRVWPTQAQLVTFPKDKPDGVASIHLPIALSWLKNPGNVREFTVVNNDGAVLMTASSSNAMVTFLFLVPAAQVEEFMLVRNLRLPLPDAAKAIATPQLTEMLAVIGTTTAQTDSTDVATNNGTPTVGEKQGGRSSIQAEDLKLTAELPQPTSKTMATELEFTAPPANEIRRGEMVIKPSTGPVSPANQVRNIFVAQGQAVVRVRLSRTVAQSFYGGAVAVAGDLHPIILRDGSGTDWQPSGYAWVQESTKSMKVSYDPQKPITAVTLLPIRQMGEKDELYLYFLVEKGRTLLSFNVGTVHSQDLNRIEVPR